MTTAKAWGIGFGLFVALSVADFLQTYVLIEGGPGREANPVAAVWLASHGWVGLAAFKATVCLCVVGAVALLARRGSPAAGRVLALGCAVLFGVGVYSRGLIIADAAETAFQERAAAEGMVQVMAGEPSWFRPPLPPDTARL